MIARKWDLPVAAAGAIAWGVFLSIIPIFEGLIVGWVVWLPVLCWREWARSKTQPFLPGFAVRMIVIAAVVAAAMLLPLKHIDFIRVGPFSSADVTLAQCGKPMGMRGSEYERHAQDRIQLTFTHPTMRQAIQDIERQTGMKVHVAGCGTGMSLMSGSWPMGCSLDPCRVP